MTMLRAGGLLDVLTSLSDCRHETVERIMERRIRGGCICVGWISTTRFVLWVFICPTNIILLHGYHAEGYRAPSLYHRLPRRGLPRPIYTARVTTPLPPLHSYHDCVYIPATTPRAATPHLHHHVLSCLLYTSPSPRDQRGSRMPSSA